MSREREREREDERDATNASAVFPQSTQPSSYAFARDNKTKPIGMSKYFDSNGNDIVLVMVLIVLEQDERSKAIYKGK